MSFRNWLIRILGGYTARQYDTISEELNLEHKKLLAMSFTHNQLVEWLKIPHSVSITELEKRKLTFVNSILEGVPIDVTKQDMSRRVAQSLFKDNLIKFDVRDETHGPEHLLIGEICVLVPKEPTY